MWAIVRAEFGWKRLWYLFKVYTIGMTVIELVFIAGAALYVWWTQ